MNSNIIQSGECSVYIGRSALRELEVFIEEYYSNARKFVLVDENILEKCWPKVETAVKGLEDCELIEIESGETNKNLEICYHLWKTLTEYKADRKTLFINLGGGVICDMGGFVSSTFKRGIDFINIPTSLLAQVDASVGGKTGIDFENFKNQIGVFSQPKAVFVYPSFIETMERRQILSGYAEMLKHALISDPTAWKELAVNELEKLNWEEIIYKSVAFKNEIVCIDPTEQGVRKLLNFGHSVGHAVESFLMDTEKQILHGEAVALGIICESYISSKFTGLKPVELDEISNYILTMYDLPEIKKSAYEELLSLMENDKKNQQGELRFSLLESIGQGVVDITVPFHMVIESFEYYNSLLKK